MAAKTRSRDSQSYRHVLLALSWYYPELHRGVVRYARDHRWHVTADLDDPVPKHWDGDGVITLLGSGEQLWKALRPLRVPIVDLSESRPKIKLPRVTTDNEAIARLAASHFLDRGYRSFAFVHRWELGVSRKRREVFQAAVQTVGFSCDVLSWESERGSLPDSRAERHKWLSRRLAKLPKPLAVFATRDTEGAEVIEACMASGLSVPEQVSVLGVDNTETICDCLSVPLSSVNSNQDRAGYEGAALLDKMMSGEQPPNSPIYIPPAGIVERRSTDMLAVEHPGVAAALQFIHDNYPRPIDVPSVARAVAMSRSGLEKAFREHYVRPPGEELRRVRMEQAKRMLRETDESIAVIANGTGFRTAQNLCRTFKLQLALTPKQYRCRH